MQITLKRFSIFCGLFSKMIQITFRPQPKSLWSIFGGKHRKNGSVLAKNWTKIIDEVTTYPYGKFVHILDPEGNAIELWEANDDFFSDLMGPTNK